jgi:hypothetical protein
MKGIMNSPTVVTIPMMGDRETYLYVDIAYFK